MSNFTQKQNLINEINNILESPNADLPSIVRKSQRLARLCNEEEYSLLFDLHLDGYDPDTDSGVRVQKWTDINKKPKWDVTKIFYQDRACSNGLSLGIPLEQIDFRINEIDRDINHLRNNGAYSTATDLAQHKSDLSTIKARIKNRAASFLKQIENEIPFESETSLNKSLPVSIKTDLPHFDVLLITVNDYEFDAVIKIAEVTLGKDPETLFGARVYYNLGDINGSSVALVRSEMGSVQPGAALATTLQSISELNPKYIIAVGIMFGVDSVKQEIGQILFSKQIQNYELQRVSTNKITKDAEIIPRGDKVTSNPQFLDRVKDAAYFWAKTHGEKLPSSELILSGEKLIDNIDFRGKIIDSFPEAKGGEMEGSGIYGAARETETLWMIIKAICDFADGNKNADKDQQQKLAAEKAANFVFYLLNRGGLRKS